MQNLPTLEEMISFIKKNLKIIFITSISFLLIFIIGVVYTVYTDLKIEKNVTNTIEISDNILSDIDESIPLEEQLEPEEIEAIVEKLQEDGVAFSFHIEKDTAEPFQTPGLLKEILVSPNIINEIEQETNVKFELNPKLVVDVVHNPNNLLMTVIIGTGDLDKNRVLAEAYFNFISNEESSFFDNKATYITQNPTVIQESIDSTQVPSSTLNSISYSRVALYSVIVLVMGSLFGMIIAIIRSVFQKEVSDIYSFSIYDDDLILNLNNNNKSQKKDELYNQIVYAVSHPKRNNKVVLSQEPLENQLVKTLQYKGKNNLDNESFSPILLANDITNINPKISIDEIIVICQKDKTTKAWYEKQRKLVNIYNTKVKVILI